jgi:hypothetical protein
MVKKEMKKTVKKRTKGAVSEKAAAPKSASRKRLSDGEINDMIAKKAYEFYLERGGAHGDDHHDWYRAECVVLSKCKK